MLDISIDASLEPIAVELEPQVEEKYLSTEETLQFDELFGKVEELSGAKSDEFQDNPDQEALDIETVESPEEKGNNEAKKAESVSKIKSFLESSLID